MDKKRAVVASIIGVVLVVLVWVGVSMNGDVVQSEVRLTVAASVFPLGDIVQNVAGSDVEVQLIVPVGASPHSYNLDPQQVVALQRASVLFQIGQGLDDVLVERALGALSDETVGLVEVDTGIYLREFGEVSIGEDHEDEEGHAHDEGVDPHYWLSVPNAKIIAQNVAQALSEVDSAHATQYAQNLETYLSELDALEDELQATASASEQKKFIAIHDAWSYFTEQYGFELVGTYEPREGQEPSPRDVQLLQELIVQNDIRTFYTEPQKISTPATRFFENELGLDIGVLDPIGGTALRTSYVEMMRANVAAIAR